MSKKLVVVIAGLREAHRQSIGTAAETRGYEVLFLNDVAEAMPHLDDAEIIFGSSAVLPQNAPKLRWMCAPTAGVERLLKPGVFASPDAALTNSSGAYGVTISEHIIMVALEMLHRQGEYSDLVRRREWRNDLPIRAISRSRITLLGTGDIGKETARRLRAFNPDRIVGVNRSGVNPEGLFDEIYAREQIERVLPKSDLLILSLPGTPETKHLLDTGRLALLPDGALIINVGRGAVIDQQALENELRAGRLFAALDVFQTEPLPKDDSLWDCPNLLITPHIAGNMTLPQTVDNIVSLFLENFENYCAGKALRRVVVPERGY